MSYKPNHDFYPVKTGDKSSSIREKTGPLPPRCGPVSVVIPTLNEEANISLLLIQLDQTLTRVGISYEAIVVDDHSTDGTLASVEALVRKENLPVRTLVKQGRPGKSFSLMEGFAVARFDILATIDGDLQYSPESLLEMLYHLDGSDMVLAERRVSRRRVPYQPRDLLSRAYIFTLSTLFGIDNDVQSGLKVFRRKVYQDVPTNPGRWSFELYLVIQALHNGYLVTNMPVVPNQRYAGTSKVRPLVTGTELMIDAFRLKLSLIRHKFPKHRCN